MNLHGVPEEPTSKGFTLLGALAFVDERYGTEGRQRLLGALDEDARHLVSSCVFAVRWPEH